MSVAHAIRRKIHRFRQPDIVAQIVRGSSSAVVINGLGRALAAVMQIVLARWCMTKAMYGTYTLVMAWVLTLAVPVGLGLPLASLRILPELAVKQDWRHYNGAVRAFQMATLAAGFAVSVVGSAVLLWLNHRLIAAGHPGLSYLAPFLIGLWMVPLVAQSNVVSEISRAMRRIVLAYGPPKILQPLAVMAAAVAIRALLRTRIPAEPVMLVSAGAMLLAVIGQTIIYRRDLAKISQEVPASYQTKRWLLFAVPMLIMSLCQIVFVNAGTLVVGEMMHLRDVAAFGVANRTVLIVNFMLFATNVAIGPEVSALYAAGQIKALQRAVTTTVKLSFYPAALGTAVLLLLGKPLLTFYGRDYLDAYPTMVALSIGCLVSTAAGPVLLLMNMTGFEKIALRVCLLAAAGYVVGAAIGVRLGGIVGAGIGCAAVQSGWNVWLCILVKKHIGVNASILRFDLLGRQPDGA